MTRSILRRLFGPRPIVLVAFLSCACDDPVHDNQVNALGPESGEPGPLHRAGQPCLACHGGSGPAGGHFAIGGTVYQLDTTDAFEGADVQLTDATKVVKHVPSNRAGNFFIRVEEWEPVAPIAVQVSFKDVTAIMGTHIGRDGSCASCHFDPKGPGSAGLIFLSQPEGDAPDGGQMRIVALCALLLAGCSTLPNDAQIGVSAPDRNQFDPVGKYLDHRCGSLDCHGDRHRNLLMFGCEGLRMDSELSPGCRATGGTDTTTPEIDATYRSLVTLEPAVMSAVTTGHGQNPELLTFVRKPRGDESHKGGTLITRGDAQDKCITSWLAGKTDNDACAAALQTP